MPVRTAMTELCDRSLPPVQIRTPVMTLVERLFLKPARAAGTELCKSLFRIWTCVSGTIQDAQLSMWPQLATI